MEAGRACETSHEASVFGKYSNVHLKNLQYMATSKPTDRQTDRQTYTRILHRSPTSVGLAQAHTNIGMKSK